MDGYNQNLFLNLTKEEKDDLSCSICHLILRHPHQCRNGHQFCHYCITMWAYEGNRASCPVCRVDGMYKENIALFHLINEKIVHCEWKRCFWTGKVEELETHPHMVYLQRSKNDAYRHLGIDTSRSRQSQRSREVESKITKQNTALSHQIQKIELQCHGKMEKIYKRILECEWRKLRGAERLRRRLVQSERIIRGEDVRMFDRLKEVEIRKRKEVEANKQRVQSLELKKEQFRECSLRRSLRQEKEIKEENHLQKRRIEEIKMKKDIETEKRAKKLDELEKIKSDRNAAFKRKLEKEDKEWKERFEALVLRLEEMERKKKAAIISMQTELRTKSRETKNDTNSSRPVSFLHVYKNNKL